MYRISKVSSRVASLDFSRFPKIILWIFLFNFVIFNIHFRQVEGSCSNLKRHEIEEHLSTKTPYRAIANLDETPYDLDGCHPTRMWGIVRHGSRNPSKKYIKLARRDLKRFKEEILEEPNSQLCNEELNRLRSWEFNVTPTEKKLLVPEGENELIELAERMQKRFPNILWKQYAPEYFYFKYTKTQRTLKSAQSFAIGLFGRDRIKEITYPEALQKDPVLRVSHF